MDTAEKTAAAGVPLTIVLAPTDAGRAELAQPQAGLSLPQRKLLSRLDGQRRLADLVGADAGLSSERIARDALRLLMLGLARSDEFVPTRQRVPGTVDIARNTPATLPAAGPAFSSSSDIAYGSRRAPLRLLVGGGIAAVVIGAAVLLLRPSAVERKAESEAARDRSAVPAPTPLPPTVTAKATPPESPRPLTPSTPVRAAEPAQAESRVVEPPHAVRTPPKAEAHAPKEEARAPVVRHDAGPPHAVQRPTTVAAVPPVSKPPAKQETANKSGADRTAPVKETTASAATPTPPAPQTAERAAAAPPATRVVDSAPATAPQTVAVATPPISPPAAPVAAAANPPAAGPRALLPSERDFAPSDTDPERLAQQAAGRAPVQRTPPIFPRDAIREGLTEGSVRARLHIAADGTVQSVETSVTDPRFKVFERPARAALMTWTFVPGASGRVYDTLVYFRAP